ncbi:hypothetical protein RclHR1_02550019 [Rhizophagus clarus]|uniref:Origin recognition complex subunit 2 n=1 Tax=Rhizophagus clarus TaxID=94130 RepID=A0A2Z6QZE7_9GLOM|nr:hypothetical protein RclHR1_02550019 [Rhizophagus clarus]
MFSISPSEGSTIAERIKRRGSRKQVETKTFLVTSKQKPGTVQLLEEKESQLTQEEREIVTEESGGEETQKNEEELDVVATLLATFKRGQVPETVDSKNPNSVLGGSTPSSYSISRRIKMNPGQNQPVPVVERDILIGSERFFEDNAPQKRRFKVRNMSYDVANFHSDKTEFSFTTERHSDELNELERSITKYFVQWEFQLNRNKNILLYGFGSKEHILEQYQAFHNNNRNITWIHFYGNDDLSTLDSNYLMLLDNLFDSQRVFLNFDLIRKAELIRDYFKVTATKTIFKIIIHDIDGPLFENREARVALILLSDIPNIHFLAISEKVSFFSVWSFIEEDKMNWHAHEATSFRDYKLNRKAETTKHSGSISNKKKIEKACQNPKLEKNEVKSVLLTFNTHRREMFYILANHIVDAKRRRNRTTWNSMNLNKFFNYCRESLICHEWKIFNLYLEDYYRQGIFVLNKTRSGETEITIPMPLLDIKAMLLDKEIFGYLLK